MATALVVGGTALAILVQLRATPLVAGSWGPTLAGHAIAAVLVVSGALLAGDGALAVWPSGASRGVAPAATVGQLAAVSAEARLAARPRPIRWRIVGASALLGFVTFLLCGGNRFTPLNLATWAMSVVTFVYATWQRGSSGARPAASVTGMLERLSDLPGALGLGAARRAQANAVVPWTLVAVLGLFVAGSAMLFWRIGDVPREMTSDHAEKLLDAQDVVDGTYRIFFPRNTGREALQFYVIAAMASLTGMTYLTMKLGTAMVAAMTMPFTFLLGRVLGGTGVGLAALAFEVCMRWLLQVGRVGLRFPFPPAFGSAIAYYTVKAIRDRRRNDFLLLGMIVGVAQHTYTALRIFPLGVAACIGAAWLMDRRSAGRAEAGRRLLVDASLMVGMAILVSMPLVRYAADDPQGFLFRSVSRIASDRVDEVPPNAVATFLSNWVDALLFFNWTGDRVWVNTIPGLPILDPVSGGLLVTGAAWCAFRLLAHREARHGYVGILALTAMLPSVLSIAYPGENPSTVRMGMAIPLVAVVVATGLVVAARRLASWLGVATPVAEWGQATRDPGWRATGEGVRARLRDGTSVAVVAAFAAGIVAWAWSINYRAYFIEYPVQHARASQHASRFGDMVRGFEASGGLRENVHVLPGAHWIDWRLIAAEVGDVRWRPIVEKLAEVPSQDAATGRRLYLLHPEDTASLEQFRRWYPGATTLSPGFPETAWAPLFVAVEVAPSTIARRS